MLLLPARHSFLADCRHPETDRLPVAGSISERLVVTRALDLRSEPAVSSVSAFRTPPVRGKDRVHLTENYNWFSRTSFLPDASGPSI